MGADTRWSFPIRLEACMSSDRFERRQSERQPLKVRVDYSAVDAFFGEFSANINEGGVFIETDSPSEIGTLVQLHFRVPDLETPIQVAGRVAWISEEKDEGASGMGIEFHELQPTIRETINELVRKLKRN